MMKRKVAQRETQRAYVHALSYSGSHIREKERRPGRTSKRFATAEISMRSALHTPFRQIPGQAARSLSNCEVLPSGWLRASDCCVRASPLALLRVKRENAEDAEAYQAIPPGIPPA